MTRAQQSSVDTQIRGLSQDECRGLLGWAAVGRIAFVVDGRPMVLPVNYRLLTGGPGLCLLLRTRPGNIIDGAPEHVAFEIDGIDHDHEQAWSVLVRGVLHHLDQAEIELYSHRFDPKPWPQSGRTSLLAIRAETVTGRRLDAEDREWALPSEAYI